jgi:V/A-type H+-transporting ATPase subunit I
LSRAEFSEEPSKIQPKQAGDWEFLVKHIIDCDKRYGQLQEYSRRLNSSISQWQDWGDFDPEAIQSLSSQNIHVKLFQVPVKEVKKFPADCVVKVVSKSKGLAKCVVVSQKIIDLPFKETILPKMSLEKMRARLAEDNGCMESIKNDIKKQNAHLANLNSIKKSLEKDLEFQEAVNGMGSLESLDYITGYIPFDSKDSLLETARREQWGITISEPGEDENVPTLIRNPAWISIVSPVFKALGILPGYRELDISPLFLIFLSLFFGMIIGDAGYGLVYFAFTFWLHKKLGAKIADKRVFYLFYLFSSCAVFWGLLTGTVFGQEWFLKAGYKAIAPILNDTKFLQAFCFFLGAFHLTLGHAWQGIRKIPSLAALSDAGWICVLWAAFFVAKTLILNDPFPFFGKWLIITGLSLVILFSHPQRNILKAIGSGLGTVALSLMNNFTDVVSYVRLFAVGLAGVAISDTVNTLAASLGSDNLIGQYAIVFAGHTINIILGPMSVLVHGIRLNVLEFSSHVGLSWSGLTYKPLEN